MIPGGAVGGAGIGKRWRVGSSVQGRQTMQRGIRTAADLRDLILAESRKHLPMCRDSWFGAVLLKPIDAIGCNWMIAPIGDDASAPCFQRLQPFLTELKSRYNIPEPQQGPNY